MYSENVFDHVLVPKAYSYHYSPPPMGPLDEGVLAGMLILIGLASIVLVFGILDYYAHGTIYRFFDRFIAPWLDNIWLLPAEDYNYNTNWNNNKRGKKTMYAGCGHYNTARYVDVWVSQFIDPENPDKGKTVVRVENFLGDHTTHDWRWLTLKGEYGWIEKEPPPPPPEPSMYISEGARDEADRILSEYMANKAPKKVDTPY